MSGPLTLLPAPPVPQRPESASRGARFAPGSARRHARAQAAAARPAPQPGPESRAEARRRTPAAAGYETEAAADDRRPGALRSDRDAPAVDSGGAGRGGGRPGPSSAFLAQSIAQEILPFFADATPAATRARFGTALYARHQPDPRPHPGFGPAWEVSPPPGAPLTGQRLDLSI